MKDIKSSTKIALGFGMIIAITCIVGSIAVWYMMNVESESIRLSKEYIPELEITANIERNYLQTMFYMRGYALSNEKYYLENGRKYLKKTSQYISEAGELVEKWPDLVQLKKAVKITEENILFYKKMIDETVDRNNTFIQLREIMDKAAEVLLKNCTGFLDIQNRHPSYMPKSSLHFWRF